ncbi:uncharacterized protein BDV14DRAFT_199758 [Aspergillus stella-maris]|uniref:uncharacterized protein n=1 Tax=Aspergillus stella-maris TaxID=1810926 RepID=UPI003CCE09BC
MNVSKRMVALSKPHRNPDIDEEPAYTGTPGTQCNPDRRVPVETDSEYSWFAGLPDSEYHFRKLGAEGAGWYLAPDGQNYIGVGKVIVVGVNEHGRKYHHVEPIPGKKGGDYDFFHQFTRE